MEREAGGRRWRHGRASRRGVEGKRL